MYLAGNPSFKMNIHTLEVTELATYSQFVVHKDSIFGCSDTEGITCLEEGITISVTCQHMLPVDDHILISNDNCMGLLSYDHDEEGNWQINSV